MAKPGFHRPTLLAAALALLLVSAGSGGRDALAHPLGGSVVNRYARVDQYRDLVRVTYVLDYGWLATSDNLPYADTNHDGLVSSAELQSFTQSIATTFGYALRLRVAERVMDFENRAAALEARRDVNGFPTLRLTFVYDSPLPAGLLGPVSEQFEDLNFEDNRVWKELTVYGSAGAEIEVPAEFTVERSRQLQSYPPLDDIQLPNQDRATWTWLAGTGGDAPPIAMPSVPDASVELNGSAVVAPTTQSGDGGSSFNPAFLAAVALILGVIVASQVVLAIRRGPRS